MKQGFQYLFFNFFVFFLKNGAYIKKDNAFACMREGRTERKKNRIEASPCRASVHGALPLSEEERMQRQQHWQALQRAC
jgi:hypothetical protein